MAVRTSGSCLTAKREESGTWYSRSPRSASSTTLHTANRSSACTHTYPHTYPHTHVCTDAGACEKCCHPPSEGGVQQRLHDNAAAHPRTRRRGRTPFTSSACRTACTSASLAMSRVFVVRSHLCGGRAAERARARRSLYPRPYRRTSSTCASPTAGVRHPSAALPRVVQSPWPPCRRAHRNWSASGMP